MRARVRKANVCMDKRNEWLWNARVTHWVFKKTGDKSGWQHIAPCMDPYFSGAIAPDEAAAAVRAFREAGVNTVFTEGLRRVMLFEQQGKTAEVIDAIRMAADACHREGMKIVHHVTTSLVGQDLEAIPEAQRDWLSTDAQTGTYSFEPLWGGWYLWCLNNPQFRTEYFRLCGTIAAETGVDGFMADEVYFRPGWYCCTCHHCRAKYRTMTGHELPEPDTDSFWGNFKNPAFRAWVNSRCASVGDFYRDLYQALAAAHPRPVLLGCKSAETLEGAQHFGDSARERMRGVNTLFIELTGTSTSLLYSWRYISANLMIYAALSTCYATPTVAIMYHRASERFLSWALRMTHGHRIKATASPPRAGEALSPENHLLNFPEDLGAYAKWFAWETEHEAELNGSAVPLATIGIVFGESTRDMLNHGIHMGYAREFMGWSERLTDAGLQYAFILEPELIPARLREFALIVLPDVTCLTELACRTLIEYIKAGGSLILTHRTGERNNDGAPRVESQRLGALLGVHHTTSQAASVEFGTCGRGKWAYFAHRPGAAVYETINPVDSERRRDCAYAPFVAESERRLQGRLMLDAVQWALDDPMPLTVRPVLRVILIKAFRKKGNGEVVIHLLNCRGEGAVPIGEHIPPDYEVAFPEVDEEISVELRIPAVREAHLFSPDWDGTRPIAVRGSDAGVWMLTIPAGALHRYAVMHVS